jgi:hypothetical protein
MSNSILRFYGGTLPLICKVWGFVIGLKTHNMVSGMGYLLEKNAPGFVLLRSYFHTI